MKIGVAKEIKVDEYRVALTPAGVRATRYSSVLISLATPIFKAASPYLVASVQIQEEPGERLGVLDLADLRGDL